MHNNVNVLNVAELYTSKWLKWQVLCYVYLTTKQNNKRNIKRIQLTERTFSEFQK